MLILFILKRYLLSDSCSELTLLVPFPVSRCFSGPSEIFWVCKLHDIVLVHYPVQFLSCFFKISFEEYCSHGGNWDQHGNRRNGRNRSQISRKILRKFSIFLVNPFRKFLFFSGKYIFFRRSSVGNFWFFSENSFSIFFLGKSVPEILDLFWKMYSGNSRFFSPEIHFENLIFFFAGNLSEGWLRTRDWRWVPIKGNMGEPRHKLWKFIQLYVIVH